MKKYLREDIEAVISDSSIAEYQHGILTEWNDERGFGFITPDSGGRKVFLHIKSLQSFARRPRIGELFFYKFAEDERGRPEARDAFQTILDEKRRIPFFHNFCRTVAGFWPLAIIPAGVLIYKTGSAVAGVVAAFVINSLLIVLFYWLDKHLAQDQCWRIPEKSLHIWELCCGWPGALYAQYAFKHKRKKTAFMVTFYCCIALNVTALFLLFYVGIPAVREMLQGWIL